VNPLKTGVVVADMVTTSVNQLLFEQTNVELSTSGSVLQIRQNCSLSVENANHLTVEVCCGPTVKEKSRMYAIAVPLLLLLRIKTDQAPETRFAFSMGLKIPKLGDRTLRVGG
jgi:hypothetical protein